MGTFSLWHWLIVLAIVLLLFGRGKIPSLMGDMAKGIKAFKAGMKEEPETPKSLDDAATPTAENATNNSAGTASEATVKNDEAARG